MTSTAPDLAEVLAREERERGEREHALRMVRSVQTQLMSAEVAKVRVIIEWAKVNRLDADHLEGEPDPDAAMSDEQVEELEAALADLGFCDRWLSVAGPGAPVVSEFAVMELASTLGMGTDAGFTLVGRVLELKYRLPRLYQRVEQLQLPVWKAFELADLTQPLTAEAAEHVDRQVEAVAGKVGKRAMERLIAETQARFDPNAAAEAAAKKRERRFFDIGEGRRTDSTAGTLEDLAGTVEVSGCLDAADAADLEAAIRNTSRALAAAGCEDSLDVRRAAAVGELARNQLALDLDTGEIVEQAAHGGRGVELVVHLSDEAFTAAGFMVGRLENTQTPVSAEVIREWCGSAARITVRPVIDLNGAVHVEQYEVPKRIKQQRSRWTDPRCVYPHCNRPADRCDCDHIQPFERGGATCSCNLAPLCRRHHRFKTHGAVTYRRIGPGAYEWEFQTGMTIVRDHLGTQPPVWPKPPPPGDWEAEPPDEPILD
ncbi:HNH endonuclease signature motif containing protein [Nocardioides nanhaiensis]|uniref:HNH endonuclease signature motif containing protein n=1 Tax=Nocardioides nanhaiensis TaxID=1476871 RepID=A0ABP8W0X8_9ACTN